MKLSGATGVFFGMIALSCGKEAEQVRLEFKFAHSVATGLNQNSEEEQTPKKVVSFLTRVVDKEGRSQVVNLLTGDSVSVVVPKGDIVLDSVGVATNEGAATCPQELKLFWSQAKSKVKLKKPVEAFEIVLKKPDPLRFQECQFKIEHQGKLLVNAIFDWLPAFGESSVKSSCLLQRLESKTNAAGEVTLMVPEFAGRGLRILVWDPVSKLSRLFEKAWQSTGSCQFSLKFEEGRRVL
jgi:hypothetical protein